MDQHPINRTGISSTYSLLRHPTLTSALSLPHHTIFFGDCIDPRSDGPDENSDDQSINNNNRSFSYSKPVMVLDLVWNSAFVLVSIAVLLFAVGEKPSTPLRFWVLGYCLQCVFHVGFVYFRYRMWRSDQGSDGVSNSNSQAQSSIIKRLESINTLVASIWWVIGFYWIVVGGQTLLRDSPRLYWLTVVFLAFDVFFILFCIGMACIVFFVAFCCIPILAVAYAIAIRKGAREDDIKSLPKYKYCHDNRLRLSDKNKESLRATLASSNHDLAKEIPLGPEDSDCCICLSRYISGTELYMLPCKHHFHCGCISKWLRINATCPLCKLNIRKGDTLA
ncbi:Zinc finger C3HC4 type (RING finger) family protein [Euphorbia peplus]|nr:Zinc finger C3HC4 type (RING finger) family protein [Euphorbia peplus]